MLLINNLINYIFNSETGGIFYGWVGIILNIFNLVRFTSTISSDIPLPKCHPSVYILSLFSIYGWIFLSLLGYISLLIGTKRVSSFDKKLIIFI